MCLHSIGEPMRYDFLIYTDYDGKVKSALVPRDRLARRIIVPGGNARTRILPQQGY